MGDYGMPTNTASDGGTDVSGSAIATAAASTITTTASVPSPTLDGTVSRCGKYYKIGGNEDCATVEKKFGISLSDFVYLNPELFTNCTNLQKNVYYCAQPVGSISTYSGYGGTTSDEYSKLSMTSAPAPTYSYGTGGRPSIPIAKDTRKDCAEYAWYGNFKYKAQSRLMNCWSLAMVWDISPEDFILWNPSMAKNGTLGNSSANASSSATSADCQPSSYDYPCTISQSTSYCVGISAATSRSVPTSSASTTAEAVSTTAMTSTGQIALPLELWQQITSYLTTRDIKSMRLAAKQFSNAVELPLQRVFLSPNPLNIAVFRAVADHEKFRHQVTEIIWDDARLARGPLIRRELPGLEGELGSDEEGSDNETEISRYQGSYELDWPFEYSDDEDEDEDEDEDDEGGDPYNELRKSSKFKSKDCPVWFKAGCAASVEHAFWRQTNEDDGIDGIDMDHPDYKSIRKLGSIGPPLSECWDFYRTLIRQQDDFLASKSDEKAFIHGLKQFPTLAKVTVTPAAHGFLFNPLYQTPMIRSFPEGFNYPIPRGWPLPVHEQPEEVYSLPWNRLNEVQKERFHGFRIVVRALAEQKNDVVEFSLDSRLLRTGINCTILEDSKEYNHLATLLKKPGFRRLDLSFTLGGTWESFPHQKLHDILRGAGDLEHLSLATTGLDHGNEHKNLNVTPVPLKDIFPIENWPKLQHFELSRFIVGESDMISFLSELPATLQSVKLSFLTFVDNGNDWHSFLTKMREGIREGRLWSDSRRRNVTFGCRQDVSLPGRATWVGKEIDEYLYGDGESPFSEPPTHLPRVGYGSQKDQLDHSR
ncbi:unnamed protein product [Penicillium salamii]|uniref:LysM domain-containing protein n=1 Tax=Penicillium salamii TaxID=1612424 RepID=A0A9W4J938_9EURO|nr:unnamed protein product [Penicillium salamii]